MLAPLFGINFMIQRNLVHCNTYNAKCFLCFSRPPFWQQKPIRKTMLFQDAFLDTLLKDFMLIVYEKGRFGRPFKIEWARKIDPNSTKWRQRAPKKHRMLAFAFLKPSVAQDTPGTTLSVSFDGFGTLSNLILNGFQCLLADLQHFENPLRVR